MATRNVRLAVWGVLTFVYLVCIPSGNAGEITKSEGHDRSGIRFPDGLSLQQIMADPDWIARSPEDAAWAHNGQVVFFRRKRLGSPVRDWHEISVTASGLKRLRDDRVPVREFSLRIPLTGDEDSAGKRIIGTRGGDLFLYDRDTQTLIQLTRTSARESDARFMHQDDQVQFTRDGVLLVRDLSTGLEREPVVLRFEDAPDDRRTKAGGDSKPDDESGDKGRKPFLELKEEELFRYLRQEKRNQDVSKKQDKLIDRLNPLDVDEPFYLGRKRRLVRQILSGDGRWLAVVTTSSTDTTDKTDTMPEWIRDDGYVHSRRVRSLVGHSTESAHQLTLIDIRRRSIHEIDLSVLPEIGQDRLAAITNEPVRNDSGESSPDNGKDPDNGTDDESSRQGTADRNSAAREHKSHAADVSDAEDVSDTEDARPEKLVVRDVAIPSVSFSRDSKYLLFQCFSADNKDRWIMTQSLNRVGRDDGLKTLHHRYDPAWINWTERTADWIGHSSMVYFLSEDSGYQHLYEGHAATGRVRQLTSGSFEISDPRVSKDESRFFVTHNRNHPGEYELGIVSRVTPELKSLTGFGGVNEFIVSPDETRALAIHSSPLQPPELFLFHLPESINGEVAAVSIAGAVQLTESTTPRFEKIDWTAPHFVQVPSRSGQQIHSRLYLPEDAADATDAPALDSQTTDSSQTSVDRKSKGNQKRPAVVFIHGAGYLQNAHKGWSGYFREFMFHSLLTRLGYVVLDMDYRASAGYGRDWRTAIYRQMGTPELEDLQDGVRWLVKEHNVDAKRVGVYGGSYGGFMTLMALFRDPELFACGAALRPVTDWAHYNHGYTSNILNTPETDPQAYLNSSPIYFAEGLKRPLLICHGMVDDNVFFKDTVRLGQRLIELRKDNWNVAMYPVEAHGFRQPESWFDEYRRILKLFEAHLQ
ncbi:MAG: S9 family peptidase [Planctomycetaceae bacterium]|nr:S9 family peptidase [Planctomycetaceae bacterium]